MALPPIVTNSPIYKAVSGQQDQLASKKEEADQPVKVQAQDTVNLSEAALVKLQADETDTQARQTANTVRDALVKNPDLTLSNNAEALPQA